MAFSALAVAPETGSGREDRTWGHVVGEQMCASWGFQSGDTLWGSESIRPGGGPISPSSMATVLLGHPLLPDCGNKRIDRQDQEGAGENALGN